MAISIVVPQLGESVAEGTVAKWLKAVGDKVRKEKSRWWEIQTDQINVEDPVSRGRRAHGDRDRRRHDRARRHRDRLDRRRRWRRRRAGPGRTDRRRSRCRCSRRRARACRGSGCCRPPPAPPAPGSGRHARRPHAVARRARIMGEHNLARRGEGDPRLRLGRPRHARRPARLPQEPHGRSGRRCWPSRPPLRRAPAALPCSCGAPSAPPPRSPRGDDRLLRARARSSPTTWSGGQARPRTRTVDECDLTTLVALRAKSGRPSSRVRREVTYMLFFIKAAVLALRSSRG